MGIKSLNEYFYKLAYGDKGADKATLVNDCLDVADAEIKANKDAKHTQGTDQGLDTGGANAVVVADVKDAVTKKHTQGTDYSNIVICADYTNPDDAITAIGASNKTLLVTEAETCDTNFTVPANVTVRFERGGKWTINTGITVTFNGQLDAGLWQIFELVGTGTVVLNTGSTPEAYPEWWGAKGDGTTDDAAIFNSVLTQLNSSTVKVMKLNSYSYSITDTIVLYQGQSIIGRNRYPSTRDQASVNDYPTQTKILFAPTSEKDLFDIYTNLGTDSYIAKVYIGGIHLYGNTTGGVTFSRYAINSKAAQSVFENLGIERFQDGIYCNYTMTNKYRDIYIGACSHACIYTSTSLSTTDTFDNVIMRESPWGTILRRARDFKFINCLWESLTTGGVNIYKECQGNEFISGYCEAVPNSAAGDNYGMFYINHDGTTMAAGNTTIVGGWWCGKQGEVHGSFLNVDYTNVNYNTVSVIGAYALYFTNGIKASANTAAYSIYSTGIKLYLIDNPYVGITNKLNETATGYEEDTWTAVIQGSGTAGTYEISYQYSNYTKIGRVVHLDSMIVMAAAVTGGGTGNLYITGSPYTKMANSQAVGAVALAGIDFTGSSLCVQFIGSGANSTLMLVGTVDDAAQVIVPIAGIAANDQIYFSITYFV